MNELEKRKVVETYFHNGHGVSQIWKLVKDLGISRATVYRLVKKFQNGGNSDRKSGSGGELSKRTIVRRERLLIVCAGIQLSLSEKSREKSEVQNPRLKISSEGT